VGTFRLGLRYVRQAKEGPSMSIIGVVLLIFLLLLLIGGLPHWGYMTNRGYGYWPSGGLGLVLIIVLVLALMGRV
jgi:hypothetical protein